MHKLFQVTWPGVCAGFVASGGYVIEAAPILKRLVLGQRLDLVVARFGSRRRWSVVDITHLLPPSRGRINDVVAGAEQPKPDSSDEGGRGRSDIVPSTIGLPPNSSQEEA